MKHLCYRVCRHLLVRVSAILVTVMLVNWSKHFNCQDCNEKELTPDISTMLNKQNH